MAEKISFSLVRYGNVLNSRGSILPILKDRLKNKSKLQITDKRMTRFFITLSQGVNFVLNSIDLMNGGGIWLYADEYYNASLDIEYCTIFNGET